MSCKQHPTQQWNGRSEVRANVLRLLCIRWTWKSTVTRGVTETTVKCTHCFVNPDSSLSQWVHFTGVKRLLCSCSRWASCPYFTEPDGVEFFQHRRSAQIDQTRRCVCVCVCVSESLQDAQLPSIWICWNKNKDLYHKSMTSAPCARGVWIKMPWNNPTHHVSLHLPASEQLICSAGQQLQHVSAHTGLVRLRTLLSPQHPSPPLSSPLFFSPLPSLPACLCR